MAKNKKTHHYSTPYQTRQCIFGPWPSSPSYHWRSVISVRWVTTRIGHINCRSDGPVQSSRVLPLLLPPPPPPPLNLTQVNQKNGRYSYGYGPARYKIFAIIVNLNWPTVPDMVCRSINRPTGRPLPPWPPSVEKQKKVVDFYLKTLSNTTKRRRRRRRRN